MMSDYGAEADPDTDKIRQVAFGYNLAPLSKLKVDQFPISDSAKCYTLVQFWGKTRLQVKVYPDQLPS